MSFELLQISRRCLLPRKSGLSSRLLATISDASPALAADGRTCRLTAATILNRAPIITPTPHPFEQLYHTYQAHLARALSSPLPTEVYFKPGSLLERKFALEENARDREAFGKDFISATALPIPKDEKDGTKSLAEQMEEEAAMEEAPQPRIHKSDKENDVKSLDRKAERNLYLIVKKDRTTNQWQFPQGGADGHEPLHKAALRELLEECGPNMDVWMVGRQPIGHYEYNYPPGSCYPHDMAKVYFFKSHILAGQCKPDAKEIVDFAWLTKEEIKNQVEDHYWHAIKDMLSDM